MHFVLLDLSPTEVVYGAGRVDLQAQSQKENLAAPIHRPVHSAVSAAEDSAKKKSDLRNGG